MTAPMTPAERVGELLDRAAQAEWDRDTEGTQPDTHTDTRREEPQ